MKTKDIFSEKGFPVVVTTDCRNINKVYPLKQKSVAGLYSMAKKHKEIKRIYIFGSSVTPKCNINSDIDICLDADTRDGMAIFNIQKEMGEICDWNCDIIMYSNMGSRLRNTIENEGVIIYEQPA